MTPARKRQLDRMEKRTGVKVLKPKRGPAEAKLTEDHEVRHLALAAYHMRAAETGAAPNPFDQIGNDKWLDLLGKLIDGQAVAPIKSRRRASLAGDVRGELDMASRQSPS